MVPKLLFERLSRIKLGLPMIWIVASLVCQYASPMFALHLTTKLLAERWLSLTLNLIFLKNSSSESLQNHLQSPVWCFELAITLGKNFKIINLFSRNLKQKTWKIIRLPFGFADLLYSRWWKTANLGAGFERSDQHSTMASWPSETMVLDSLILGLPFSGWTETKETLI